MLACKPVCKLLICSQFFKVNNLTTYWNRKAVCVLSVVKNVNSQVKYTCKLNTTVNFLFNKKKAFITFDLSISIETRQHTAIITSRCFNEQKEFSHFCCIAEFALSSFDGCIKAHDLHIARLIETPNFFVNLVPVIIG